MIPVTYSWPWAKADEAQQKETLKNLAERHPETYKMVEICLKNGLENKTVVEF